MKKYICSATLLFLLAGCYTPLNNSGVATTKPWLEIAGKKSDFNGKQYDSCYRFNLHFWPQEAAEVINLKEACISGCCWRNDKEEVVLDFNKHFESDLAIYGRARKYSPGKITLKVSHASWLNTTKVTVRPQGAISNSGLVKLSYTETENPTRLAQLENLSRQQAALAAAKTVETSQPKQTAPKTAPSKTNKKTVKKQPSQTISPEAQVKSLFLQQAGTKADTFFYQMDKTYKKQGAVFLLSERLLHVSPTEKNNLYTLSCQAKARTGLDPKQLHASTFSCGNWQVNLQEQTVIPLDKRAELVWNIR